MEQSIIIETLKTSLKVNIWVERNHFLIILMAVIVAIFACFSLIIFFELLGGIFLFAGIFFLGFVGIAAHIRYYFYFERNRKVELYSDRMVIIIDDQMIKEILKKDILKIMLFDKLKYESNSNGYNMWPTFLDPFYYLELIGRNQERIVLTCLLDIRLKKKIAAWYGKELEHEYQFFPFPEDK
jgi:hypothetical protein